MQSSKRRNIMNRKEMIAFCVSALEQVRWDIIGYYFTAYEVNMCIKLVESYKKGKQKNIRMEAIVNDGFLFINGDAVGRIAPRLTKVKFTERGYWLEEQILKREEIF